MNAHLATRLAPLFVAASAMITCVILGIHYDSPNAGFYSACAIAAAYLVWTARRAHVLADHSRPTALRDEVKEVSE